MAATQTYYPPVSLVELSAHTRATKVLSPVRVPAEVPVCLFDDLADDEVEAALDSATCTPLVRYPAEVEL